MSMYVNEFPTLVLPMTSHITITKPGKPLTIRTISESPSKSSSKEESEPNIKVSVGMQVFDGSQQEMKS